MSNNLLILIMITIIFGTTIDSNDMRKNKVENIKKLKLRRISQYLRKLILYN